MVVEQHWVHGVKSQPVPLSTWLVRLEPVFEEVSSLSPPELVALPEPFLRDSTFGLVYGWPESLLAQFDKFGLLFPERLIGPILLPEEWNEQWLVKVWVTPEYYKRDNGIAVTRIVDELMANGGHTQLTMEDRRFLVGLHPSRQSHPDSAYHKLFTLSLALENKAAEVSDG